MHASRCPLWLLAMFAAATAFAAEPANLLPNPGFERGHAAKPDQWRIRDKTSTVTTERAHAGERGLKIVDPDNKTGSDVRSATVPIEPGKDYGLWIWTYLENGQSNGLGVYFDLLDKAGKRMRDASEATCTPVPMVKGEWVRNMLIVKPPAQATALRVWLHTFSTAVVTCYVDDLVVRAVGAGQFGPAARWRGGLLDEKVHKDWPFGLRWEHGRSTAISRGFAEPQDWSKFGAVTFNMHLAKPTTSTCMLIITSENPKTKGGDYYSFKVRLDWSGWKTFTLPFDEVGRAREPLGWQHIDRVSFTASGWGQTVVPATVVTLDGFKCIHMTQTGRIMSDEQLFQALDLEQPALEAVKAAVHAGDLAAAKAALAKYFRDRTAPKWLIDWRKRPLAGVKVPGPQDDKAPNQWDYYSTFIKLDWQGWKHFEFKKSDFSPKAYVEGKGWKGKKPIGWHWIQYMAVNASGWGLKPDPGETLYFDDVRLVGKDKSVTLADFEGDEAGVNGLQLSTEQAKSGKASGKWASMHTNTHTRWDNIPHDWTDFDALEFWVYSAKPSSARVVLVLDSDVPRDVTRAEQFLRHEWTYPQGPGKRGTIKFGPKIDWAANPTKGEARTHLWNESLNRHFHFNTLSQAYWNTGKEKYAKEIADEIVDWFHSNPQPMLTSGNGRACEAWQTLTTSIRLAAVWPNAVYRCLDSPSFTDEVICTVFKSTCQQARHLVRWPSTGNWLTAESNGLFTAGMLFPEFKEAKEWRATAIARLYKQLDNEVYPDGMEYELASGYNNWVVSEFAHILELADLNDLRGELPADFQAKIEKCYNYQLFACMPNGCIPGLNDSGNSSVVKSLATGYKLFPNRDDFLYIASRGESGRAPDHNSHAFPWCGHYVMRSGWDAGATFLLFDAGPFGYGHQHEDKLHFVFYAHGRQLVLDPGNFSYDHSRWRRYVLGTYGHNTVMVDGLNQHRRGKRETYFWPRPWQGDAPKDNDAVWLSTDAYDFAAGVYRDGYGPARKLDVVHRRSVLWVKPSYFIIVDTLTPKDNAEHKYDALFHLDAADAKVDGLAVESLNQGDSNVRIVARPDPAMTLAVVKGKTEEPVQGWANGPWRAIPCAIYSKSAKGVARMAFVMAAWGKDGQCPVASVEAAHVDGAGIGGVVRLANGETHRFVFADQAGTMVKCEELECNGYARVQVRSSAGEVLRVMQVAPR